MILTRAIVDVLKPQFNVELRKKIIALENIQDVIKEFMANEMSPTTTTRDDMLMMAVTGRQLQQMVYGC